MRELSLPSGQTVQRYNEPIETVFFPNNAVLSVIATMGSGQSVETAIVGFESAVGLLHALADLPAARSAFAQIGGAAIGPPASVIRRRAAESSHFLKLVLSFAAANAAQAEQSVACNALHPVGARLARWLLMTDDRLGTETVPP
jgi:CRP-like cAMP-binding protein